MAPELPIAEASLLFQALEHGKWRVCPSRVDPARQGALDRQVSRCCVPGRVARYPLDLGSEYNYSAYLPYTELT